jgi:hypothetical protein
MAKNILKEAIADAKAVREVALANAKAALEEAFTPKLQSMLSAKLSQSLNEEEDEEVDLDEMLDMDEEDTIEEMDMYDEDNVEENLDEEIDLEEILNELELDEDDSEEMEEGLDKVGEEDDDINNDGKSDKTDEYLANRRKAVGKAMKKESTEHFDLDVLLEEINNLDEKDKSTRPKPMPTNPNMDEGHCGPGMVMNNEGHCMEMRYDEDYGISENDMMSEGPEIFTAMAGLAGVIGSAGILSAIEIAMEDPSFKEKHPKAYDALTKIFGFFRKIGGDVGKGIKENDYLQEVKDIAYGELRESRKAINKMKSELNEVNLLNSKLLYVNRIFKANTLDEGQKLRVVETLDKAGSVKEAKLIHETIKDSFSISKTRKTNTTPKKSIREGLGMASKAAGTSTAPKKSVLNESNDMVTRMQKLANIKIKQ